MHNNGVTCTKTFLCRWFNGWRREIQLRSAKRDCRTSSRTLRFSHEQTPLGDLDSFLGSQRGSRVSCHQAVVRFEFDKLCFSGPAHPGVRLVASLQVAVSGEEVHALQSNITANEEEYEQETAMLSRYNPELFRKIQV